MASAQLSQPTELHATSGVAAVGGARLVARHPRRARRAIADTAHTVSLGTLAALFLLTAAFGRSFSKLGIGAPWLHPTEILLLATGVAAVIATPPHEALERLRRIRVLALLAALWAIGAIATVRGLGAWGFDRVLHDVGLIEYSAVIALLAIVIGTRAEFLFFCAVLAVGGLLAIVAQAVTLWSPLEWDLDQALGVIFPAAGMCAALGVAWVLARTAAGLRPAAWQLAVAVIGVVVITLGSARSVWLGLLVAIVLVVALAASGRRIQVVATAIPLLAVGVALSVVIGDTRLPAPPGPAEAAASLDVTTRLPDTVAETSASGGTSGSSASAGGAASPSPAAAGDTAPAAPGAHAPPGLVPRSPDSVYPDPGMELAGVGPYTAFGAASLSVSTRFAASGEQSLRAPYEGDLRLLKTLAYVPLQAGVPYELSAWVYVPADWDGGAVEIGTDSTWTGANEDTTRAATTETGRWVKVTSEVTPVADDLLGGVHIRTTAPPSRGQAIFVDAVSVSPPAGTPTAEGDVNGIGELGSSFRASSDRVNAEWRLAFWGYLLDQTASQPLLGAGFGRPADFKWNGTVYDRRTGNERNPFDVSGPHNSFIDLLYRTGVPGLLCLFVIIGVALFGLARLARRTEGENRSIAIWLVAGLAITGAVASLTVALEGPFMGIFFWAVLGLSLLAPAILGPGADGGETGSARL